MKQAHFLSENQRLLLKLLITVKITAHLKEKEIYGSLQSCDQTRDPHCLLLLQLYLALGVCTCPACGAS